MENVIIKRERERQVSQTESIRFPTQPSGLRVREPLDTVSKINSHILFFFLKEKINDQVWMPRAFRLGRFQQLVV